MAFLGAAVLGYLTASFVVAFYFAAAAWGTPGTVLGLVIMAMFPAMPVWFALQDWWLPVVAFCALFVVGSLVFWSVLKTERVSRRGRLLGMTVLGILALQCISAPFIFDAFNPTPAARSQRSLDHAMLVSAAILFLFAVPYLWWLRTGHGDPRPARSALRVPNPLTLGIALVGRLTAGQFLALAVLVVIAMYGLWGVLSVWFYPLDDERIDITVREIAGLARDRLLLRYSIIATVGAIGAGLVMWKARSRK